MPTASPRSHWLLKVHAPFWPVTFRHLKRTIDLAGISHALHQRVAFAPARVCFRCCGPCCYRQVMRNDLLCLAGPAHSADTGAALLDGDEATVSTAAASDSTPFIRISRPCADRKEHRCGDHDNNSKKYFAHEGISIAMQSVQSNLTNICDIRAQAPQAFGRV